MIETENQPPAWYDKQFQHQADVLEMALRFVWACQRQIHRFADGFGARPTIYWDFNKGIVAPVDKTRIYLSSGVVIMAIEVEPKDPLSPKHGLGAGGLKRNGVGDSDDVVLGPTLPVAPRLGHEVIPPFEELVKYTFIPLDRNEARWTSVRTPEVIEPSPNGPDHDGVIVNYASQEDPHSMPCDGSRSTILRALDRLRPRFG